jgi:hypothetical protein
LKDENIPDYRLGDRSHCGNDVHLSGEDVLLQLWRQPRMRVQGVHLRS